MDRENIFEKFIRKLVSLYLNAIRVTLSVSWVGPIISISKRNFFDRNNQNRVP